MDLKELLSSLSSPGDLAAILIGYASGFAVDVFFFPDGLPSVTVASVTAAGVLGAKKAIDALATGFITSRKNKRRLRDLERRLGKYLVANDPYGLLSRLRSRRDLWMEGLLKDEEFEAELERVRLLIVEQGSKQLHSGASPTS